MPELKLASIVSASEAFEKFVASSLLDSRRHKPFKGKPGVESNVVIIKLAKEDTITYIDIGNEFTALIEIQVAKSCYDNPIYSTLLDTKFLMTPEESKKEKNGNKWHRFSKDDFNSSVLDSKWDLVKQSFNSKIPYGLTFISLTGGEEEIDSNALLTPLGCALTPTVKTNSTGNELKRSVFDDFEICLEKEKEEKMSPVSAPKGRIIIPRSADGLILDHKGKQRTPAGLTLEKRTESFEKWKNFKEGRNKNLAEKTPKANQSVQRVIKVENSKDASQTDLFDLPIESHAQNDTSLPIVNEQENYSPKTPSRKRLSHDSNSFSNKRVKVVAEEETAVSIPCTNAKENEEKLQKGKPDSSSKTPISTNPKTPLVYPPNLINPLKDVVLTLSGFQNPLRTQLREKALSLGAVYSNDMSPKVTHVLSAFRNTPKAKQAGSSVFIVSSFWLDRCVMERRRLDENLFSLKN
ncbi:unnamed protein product [Auanema sp. JU1783]|nr:unnamed protein product [Auanema sp. JU1783]